MSKLRYVSLFVVCIMFYAIRSYAYETDVYEIRDYGFIGCPSKEASERINRLNSKPNSIVDASIDKQIKDNQCKEMRPLDRVKLVIESKPLQLTGYVECSDFFDETKKYWLPASSIINEGEATDTSYDPCKQRQTLEHSHVQIGCLFPFPRLGNRKNGFAVEQASPSATKVVIDKEASLLGLCDKAPDDIYVAYSPYEDGELFILRDGKLLARRPIDRVLAHDLIDKGKKWNAWPAGQEKGFLTCAEQGR